jgi:hypothetical protein
MLSSLSTPLHQGYIGHFDVASARRTMRRRYAAGASSYLVQRADGYNKPDCQLLDNSCAMMPVAIEIRA